jgi:hypothetical protein
MLQGRRNTEDRGERTEQKTEAEKRSCYATTEDRL